MPVFDATKTDLTTDEAALFALLHPTPQAQEAARERGRRRAEHPTMAPAGTAEAALAGAVVAPVS